MVNNPKQPLHPKNYFQNVYKRIIKNFFKKLTLFFLLNPVPFYRQGYQEQKGLVTSEQLLFRLQNKYRKIDLLIYILSDQV